MADVITLEGVALAYVEREFQSFVDRKTGEQVAGGVTRTLWVGTDFSVEPTQIKVSAERAPLLANLKRGTQVKADCLIFAQGNRLSYRLEAVKLTAAASAA